MVVVNASSVLAVLLEGADEDVHAFAILNAHSAFICPTCVLECSTKFQRKRGTVSDRDLDQFLQIARLQIVDVNSPQLGIARSAFGRFGKGTGHPAQLNFGDCFSYALAKTLSVPLLYKGKDFSQTDLTSALPA